MSKLKCLHCVWAKYVGTGFTCPWPAGMCMKPDEEPVKKKKGKEKGKEKGK